ncbi:chaperone NapD [uncultured Pelagimonas sp.]|uniref:chaperone NapD n=1 Tax=uncultured Pelagimonas sp. TaxID=1618102 RepID=UPI00261D5816|nr:chaperone NapD [uncultured Pelagimonas sp.]
MLNICGCLVHVMPGMADSVIEAINATDGGEVHAHENGRIVVTVEDAGNKLASDQIMDMHQIPGVLTVTLTYHHFEPLNEAPNVTPGLQQAAAPAL